MQTATCKCPRASKWASKCAPATSIRWDIRGCRGTHVENWERSIATTEFTYFRIPTRISWVRIRSTFTRCASRRVNYGVYRLRRKTACTQTCGTTTLSQRDPMRGPENPAALPQLPRDAGGPVFAEPWQAQAFA